MARTHECLLVKLTELMMSHIQALQTKPPAKKSIRNPHQIEMKYKHQTKVIWVSLDATYEDWFKIGL